MRNQLRITGRLGFASLACCIALAGCVVAPARPGYTSGGYVAVAPPPAQVEVIGVAPAPGYVWIGGYWGWTGARHEWVGGHWEASRAGYHWVAHTWEREDRGWRMNPGHWEHERH